MKIIFKTTFFLILFYSCTSEYDENNIQSDNKLYKISSLTSTQRLIDLNNDGVINSNILLEITNYSSYPYDLEIKIKNNNDFISFYFPSQYITYDLNCCPNGFVEFSRDGFIVKLDKGSHFIENLIIDDDNKIKNFLKISETKYKLTLIKAYYDFNTLQNINNEFEIIYELND